MSNATLQQPDDHEVVDDVPIVDALLSLRWETPADVDDSVLSAAGAALDEGRVRSTRQPRWWRLSWPRAIAASLLLAGAVAAAVLLWAGPSVTFAEVAKAVRDKRWVHLRYDNGREEWTDLTTGNTYSKDVNGVAAAIDVVVGKQYTYIPALKSILENKSYTSDKLPPHAKPGALWEQMFSPEMEEIIKKHPESVERHEEKLEGHGDVVRFDTYHPDAAGRRQLVTQFWADPKTRLPVRMRRRLQEAERVKPDQEYAVADFEFPDTGPTGLADLGVPKDTPIVKNGEPPPADVKEVISREKAAADRFPKRYRAIYRGAGQYGATSLQIFWRDGQRTREEHYFVTAADQPKFFLKDKATPEEVMTWVAKQTPYVVNLHDGKRIFNKTGPMPAGAGGVAAKPTVYVMNANQIGINPLIFPHDYQWLTYADSTARLMKPAESFAPKDVPAGCIGVLIDSVNRRAEYWIDPAHDSMCVRMIFSNKEGASWIAWKSYILEDLAQLPDGQWFARTRRSIDTLPKTDPKQEIKAWTTDFKIDLKLLGAGEFPDKVFDGEDLMKGAKIESY